MPVDDNKIIASVRQWVESFVVDMNLCPFTKRELAKNRIRFSVTEANTEEQLLTVLESELELLNSDASIETTLLVHAQVLRDFYDYNEFLNYADKLLVQMSLDGVFQFASFHPNYQFAGTDSEDAENYTNRSPYPMLHILREATLERAIADYPDVAQIPVQNLELMESIGREKLRELREACFNRDIEP